MNSDSPSIVRSIGFFDKDTKFATIIILLIKPVRFFGKNTNFAMAIDSVITSVGFFRQKTRIPASRGAYRNS